MKKSLIYIALLLSCVAMAQHTTQPPFMQMQSTSAYAIGSSSLSYEMTAAPFSDETPSSRNGPRKAPPTTTGGTDNQPGITTPVGDAVLPLMLMALALAGIVYLRRRRKTN